MLRTATAAATAAASRAQVRPLPPSAAAAEAATAAAAVAAVRSGAAGWGTLFTPRMLSAEWATGDGGGSWSAPVIGPHEPLSLAPSASALHYALQGFKAYRGVDGRMRLMRPDINLRRLATSATRLTLPAYPPEALLPLITQLVGLDAPLWCPPEAAAPAASSAPGGRESSPSIVAGGTTSPPSADAAAAAAPNSLYLRPVILSTDPKLGVSSPRSALLYVIASPVGGYFQGGRAARAGLKLLVDTSIARAARGGTGAVKAGANYAGTIAPAAAAAADGCDQMLWVGEDGSVAECGMMNFFAVYATGEVVTPTLDGTILPGVTRQCVLELVDGLRRDDGVGRGGSDTWQAVEATLPLATLLADVQAGRVVEMFGTGTAASVLPVSTIRSGGRDYAVEGGGVGLGDRLRDALDAIATGRTADASGSHPWTVLVGKEADVGGGEEAGVGGGRDPPRLRRYGTGGGAAW